VSVKWHQNSITVIHREPQKYSNSSALETQIDGTEEITLVNPRYQGTMYKMFRPLLLGGAGLFWGGLAFL